MNLIIKKIILHVSCLLGLFYLTKYLSRHKLQILCYHGFETLDESQFRPKLFIHKNTFSKRLALIKKYNFQVLPLGKSLRQLKNNSLPNNSIAITIDDGFYSVLTVAEKILTDFNFPSTLYLTTYHAQKQTPVFGLLVQYLFWKTKRNAINIKDCIWNNESIEKIDISNQAKRNKLVSRCIQHGEKKCSDSERSKICEQLGDLLDVDYEKIIQSRTLSLVTLEEAKLLASNNIDIQLHTHRHVFPTDNQIAAKKEITDNRAVLKQIVDYPSEHFCYPSGVWNQDQWPWLEETQVISATTCNAGFNTPATPALGLNRFLDGENISDIEFKAEIFGFLEMLRLLKSKISTTNH